ncbi:hypothetical protein TIFTF001_036351 [Ficus carica]|uniref:Uncharacterized protein n=1 Tax=Ficus carica TaxID=3494 RepID=A0AA88EDF7_FICCA|nr:hypothetical protein TIFTF001_036351 [Ficus carica]
MCLVEELTQKHNENQTLRSQLAAIMTQATYSYYYNPYAGYSLGASARGWQQATPYYTQGMRATAHSSQPRGSNAASFHAGEHLNSERSTNIDTTSARIQFPEKHNPNSKINTKITIAARRVRETPLTKQITSTPTPKFGSVSFPRYRPTIQDAMHRAKGFIELEEENERVERELTRTREEIAKAREERERTMRRDISESSLLTREEKHMDSTTSQKSEKSFSKLRIHHHRCQFERPSMSSAGDNPGKHLITFHSNEATNLSRPHDDALVFTLSVSNYEVNRILVDYGSSVDVIFLLTL